MAEAYYSTELKLSGTKEELVKAIETIKSFEAGEVRLLDACICSDKKRVRINDMQTSDEVKSFIIAQTLPITIQAEGPWGSFGDLSEVDLFKELSDVIPYASFTCHVSGQTTYYEESLDCELKDQKLHITTFMEANEWIYDDYINEVKTKLSYMDFLNLFNLDENAFDEDAYEAFLDEAQHRSAFLCRNYKEFSKNIDAFDISEANYAKARQVIDELGIDFDVYSMNHDAGKVKHELYDPIENAKVLEKVDGIIEDNTASNIQTEECYNGFFVKDTIILTVNETRIDRALTTEQLKNDDLVDEEELAEINIDDGYCTLRINKPVLLWDEFWTVSVYFEDYSDYPGYDGFGYCATFFSLECSKDDKTDFQLIKKLAQNAFGKTKKIDSTDYAFKDTRSVYIRKRGDIWRLEVFSANA